LVFPTTLDGWRGREDRLEQIYLDKLKLDDYIISDYVSADGDRVNLYVAYYESQQPGEAAHSPRSCLPGGGWVVKELSQKIVEGVYFNGKPLSVNRVVIRKGDYTQVVYYWFQQRGRDITNEYLVKWYLLVDVLTKSRTDGALVRLTTVVGPGQDIADADNALERFATVVVPELESFIPD
jgi:EpsI family protein